MRSLRTRITVTALCVILTALVIVTILSAIFIRKTESLKSDQLLEMLCETGERSLDYYFDSVQNSVLKVASFVENDLEGLDDEKFEKHMEKAREFFGMMASKTKGVLTYYYRIDPSVSSTVKGFWYIDLTGEGFEEHEVTDITLYDVEDTSKLVWFTVPKHEGRPIWLAPYITDNLDVRVISYDAPVYWNGQFIGVVGIEVDYSTMADAVDSIRFFDSGYAYLSDAEGNIFYHPHLEQTQLSPVSIPEISTAPTGEGDFVRYTYGGVEKVATWLPLSNGMRLNVTVPVSETQGEWKGLVLNIALVAIGVLVISSLTTLFHMKNITRPLEQLTEAAQQVDKGNFDIDLPYDKDDEVGRLTKSFKKLVGHVKAHINDLNEQVFVDSLTGVKNKGAFSKAVDEIQEQIKSNPGKPEFAIGAFDCDDLKKINDRYGHERGDEYLKAACHLIGPVFKHSPVFRVGGDEFNVILKDEDYRNMASLLKEFDNAADKINAQPNEPWEHVCISKGFAVYDPSDDSTVIDVIRRADKLMYEDKRDRKMNRS